MIHIMKQRKKKAEKLLKNAIPKASEWHKSEQGREWHKQHGKEVFANLEPIKYICTYCGQEFETKNRYSKTSNTFCSNKCKSAFRRASGIDDVIRGSVKKVENSLQPTNTQQQKDVKSVSIKSIEFVGCEDVYNMEVADNHNFAVNGGIIVHNCMDATRYFVQTMGIYRKR